MSHRIVVIGAGYAGLAVARRLAGLLRGARITLVNAVPDFVERVRLHELACGREPRRRPLAEAVAGTGIELVVGRVGALDPDRRELLVEGLDAPLGYDTLVYALGSDADTGSVPGAAEHALSVASADGARALRARLAAGARTVTVVGGGLTGIEAACELAETHPDLRVRLLSDTAPEEPLSPRGRAHLRAVFDRLGIEAVSGARVDQVRADALRLADGRVVDTDVTVWTTGFVVPDLAARAGLEVDRHGRVVVDPTLRSVSHPDVYAVGDSALVHKQDGQELRMACATGLPVALHAARSLAARLTGREATPLRFRYFTRCISLGRRDGLIQFVDRDDNAVPRVLTGRTAARLKELVVRGAALSVLRPGLVSPPQRRRTVADTPHRVG